MTTDTEGPSPDRPGKGSEMTTETERLVAALAIALFDAHPVYANTTGWRGGIGGAAVTPGCSINNPPPADEWMSSGMSIETPLRDYLRGHPEFDLDAAKRDLTAELRAEFDGWMHRTEATR